MEKNILKTFGPVLRQLRNSKNITQEELSERVGVASPYISMLESGKKYPNLEMLFKLAESLGVKASDLVVLMEKRSTYFLVLMD